MANFKNIELNSLDKKFFNEIYDIKVLDGGLHFKNSDSKAENTFVIINKKNTLSIKWYFTAEDTTRTFTVSYKLKGAMRIGENDSQFYWTYLDKGWGVKTYNMSISQSFENETINIPFYQPLINLIWKINLIK